MPVGCGEPWRGVFCGDTWCGLVPGEPPPMPGDTVFIGRCIPLGLNGFSSCEKNNWVSR